MKVKHNNRYTTQYLHMQKANVKVGQLVEQGEWGTELKRSLSQAAYAHDSMSFAEYKLK